MKGPNEVNWRQLEVFWRQFILGDIKNVSEVLSLSSRKDVPFSEEREFAVEFLASSAESSLLPFDETDQENWRRLAQDKFPIATPEVLDRLRARLLMLAVRFKDEFGMPPLVTEADYFRAVKEGDDGRLKDLLTYTLFETRAVDLAYKQVSSMNDLEFCKIIEKPGWALWRLDNINHRVELEWNRLRGSVQEDFFNLLYKRIFENHM
ncbi:MAG: hypothetical protein GYA24_23380 [Candidatus Lokiarchaeota archaeon]|nr:hypothetical protein [Candidatus Lokiarchaeota archaeon]